MVALSSKRTAIAARQGPLVLIERIALAALSMLVSINVCTGFPLLALWLGSRAASGNIFSWTPRSCRSRYLRHSAWPR